MFVEVETSSTDILPDCSAIGARELPLYFTDLPVAGKLELWGELPPAEVGEVTVTTWGTRCTRLRPGEGVKLNDCHSFAHTGVEPIAHLALSPTFADPLDRDTKFLFLTVIKFQSASVMCAHAVNEGIAAPGILQHWLIGCPVKASLPPTLISRMSIRSGVPRAVRWAAGVVEETALFAYISQDGKCRLCEVDLGVAPARLQHRDLLTLPQDICECLDLLRVAPSRYRIGVGCADGHVRLYDIEITQTPGSAGTAVVVGRAAYFMDPAAVSALSFLSTMRGYVFTVGLASGRVRVCDIRLNGGPHLFYSDYMTRRVRAIKWPSDYGGIVTVQNDGLIISLTGAESSHHHFIRGLPSKPPTASKANRSSVHRFWSETLCPKYRSVDFLKCFDPPAICCDVSMGHCSFTFDCGMALTGSIIQLDLKTYADVNLFAWSIVAPPDGDAAAVKEEDEVKPAEALDLVPVASGTPVSGVRDDTAEAKRLLQKSKDLLEAALAKAITEAETRGLHILKCGYADFDAVLGDYWPVCRNEDWAAHVDALSTMAITSVAGSSEYPIFAYGSQLGLIHLYEPHEFFS